MEYTNPGQIKTILEQYDCFIPSPEPPARGQNEKITFLYEDINSAGRAVKSNAAGPVGKITVPGDPRQILFNDAVTKGEKGVMGAAEHFYYYDNPALLLLLMELQNGPRCSIGYSIIDRLGPMGPGISAGPEMQASFAVHSDVAFDNAEGATDTGRAYIGTETDNPFTLMRNQESALTVDSGNQIKLHK